MVLSIIILGYIERTFETGTWFEIVPIVVGNCKKIYVLMGTDVLNIN